VKLSLLTFEGVDGQAQMRHLQRNHLCGVITIGQTAGYFRSDTTPDDDEWHCRMVSVEWADERTGDESPVAADLLLFADRITQTASQHLLDDPCTPRPCRFFQTVAETPRGLIGADRPHLN
jgi:hypothetical protein